jgi:uncharacterized SAM-binding protein YcdF (DUF218 family)
MLAEPFTHRHIPRLEMDTLFYLLSKYIWALISPGSLLVILAAAVWLLLKFGRQRLANMLTGLLVFTLLFISLLPVGEWLLYPLEARFPVHQDLPQNIDGIILLGGSYRIAQSASWQQVELRETAERDLAFLRLARHYPEAKLVFTGGGLYPGGEYSEAALAKRLFDEQGLDISRIIFENLSRNTYENAVNTRILVEPRADENWLLITTSWHMPRAVGVFCKVQWRVMPYPVDHWTQRNNLLRLEWDFSENLRMLHFAFREWTGLLAYRITGKTSALIPGLCTD